MVGVLVTCTLGHKYSLNFSTNLICSLIIQTVYFAIEQSEGEDGEFINEMAFD